MKIVRVKLADGRTGYEVHHDYALDQVAEMAREMLLRHGLAQGYPDGEDSAGRAKWRPLGAEEAARRALAVAAAFFGEARSGGHVEYFPGTGAGEFADTGPELTGLVRKDESTE